MRLFAYSTDFSQDDIHRDDVWTIGQAVPQFVFFKKADGSSYEVARGVAWAIIVPDVPSAVAVVERYLGRKIHGNRMPRTVEIIESDH